MLTPLAASTARTFPVKIRFADDKGGQLKAGMSALAQVPNGEPQQVLTVPRDAIHRTHAGTVVWANLDGKAMSIPVKVLFGNGDRYAVGTTRDQMPPLTPDMQVVIEGGERLMFPGQPLMITQSQVSAKP